MAVSLSVRDRRALLILGVALLLFVLLQFDVILPRSGGQTASRSAIQAAEERLLLAQARAKQMPLVSAEHEAVAKSLAAMEAGLLRAETAPLAQAEMREIVGALLRAEGIPMQSSQFASVELESPDFARVPLIVSFDCGIEQFVNLMAAVANASQLLSTRRIRIRPDQGGTKRIRVELTVAGYLPASRTPELEKKAGLGGGRF